MQLSVNSLYMRSSVSDLLWFTTVQYTSFERSQMFTSKMVSQKGMPYLVDNHAGTDTKAVTFPLFETPFFEVNICVLVHIDYAVVALI